MRETKRLDRYALCKRKTFENLSLKRLNRIPIVQIVSLEKSPKKFLFLNLTMSTQFQK